MIKHKLIKTGYKTILILIFLFSLCPILFSLIIYEIAKVECKITRLYEEYMPDDPEKADILKVPYIAEGEIIRIIPDEKNLDPHKIHNLKNIRINWIDFSNPELKEELKAGVVVIGYLHYHVVEYHHYGYKTSLNIKIIDIKNIEDIDSSNDNQTPVVE